MRKPVQILFQALVGAFAGTAAGPLLVGLLGALTSIPAIVNDKEPFTAFLAGFVMFTLFMGIPAGAPVGAVIGLVIGGIRGWKSGTSVARTTAPTRDLVTSPADGEGVMTTRTPASRSGCGLLLVVALAVPGVILLVLMVHGYRDRAQFDRFSAEVEKLGGSARDEIFEGFSFTVDSIEVDLSSTATDDDALAHLARDPMFQRVRSLSLAGTRVTDRGLAVLDEHPWFSYLDLSNTSITDRGLASMPRCCPNMLKLSGTRITDATFRLFDQQAEGRPNRHIDLTDTHVSEERVREFVKSHWMTLIDYGPSLSPIHTH